MAFTYFSKLPIIDYPISKTQTKKGRDILHRFFVDQKYANINEYIMKYRVQDGDAMDIISSKLYGRADYHSIIMFINPSMDTFGGGLPISSAIQDEYMNTIYSDDLYRVIPILPKSELGTGGISGGYIYPIFGYGLEEGEIVYSWPLENNLEVDEKIAARVKEWNPRMLTIKLEQISGVFKTGMTLGNQSKTALFVISKKTPEKDSVHHFEAIKNTFSGTPLKKGTIIDPLSCPSGVFGGIELIPIGLVGLSGGKTGAYSESLAYLYNTVGIPDAYSSYIRAVTNSEEEYRNQEKNRTINVPNNNQRLIDGMVLAVNEILDGVQ